jgi:hypothetical protein
MRSVWLVCACACLLAPRPASADQVADDLRARGEQLAKDGRLSEAIESFKASNKLSPRATNYCLIGLAYTRRELWPQAEVMIDRCKKLATPQDPLPDWLPELDKVLAKRLTEVEVAPIELVVDPPDAKAELTVSSWAPDEQFEPRTIHLPPGSHHVAAVAPGFQRAEVSIEVKGKQPQRILITLKPNVVPTTDLNRTTTPTQQSLSESPPPEGQTSSHLVPRVVMGVGAVAIAAGIIVHVTAFRTAANHLDDATDSTPDPTEYDAWSGRFDTRRNAVVGLYVAGAIALGVGLFLDHRASEQDVHPSVALVHGGGLVTIGWSR